MLKRDRYNQKVTSDVPAAFRRLCVETGYASLAEVARKPAAFRRLCVETAMSAPVMADGIPAAFRRLCVETSKAALRLSNCVPAAFRRLCVETALMLKIHETSCQPPSGGCVLKPPSSLGRLGHGPAAFRRLCVETRPPAVSR